MKKRCICLTIFLLSLPFVANAQAEVNEEISFTSYADEPLVVDLAVADHQAGWLYYDLYVEPFMCSFANIWVDAYHAPYSICFYGELTDDFYGCIESEFSDGYDSITIDHGGYPALSFPPEEACDAYYFESPYTETEVYVVEEEDSGPYISAGAGCFINSLKF